MSSINLENPFQRSIDSLLAAQQNIASSRESCDEGETLLWDTYQSSIDDLKYLQAEQNKLGMEWRVLANKATQSKGANLNEDQLKIFNLGVEAMCDQLTTPSSRWLANGQVDPHDDRYNCERVKLAMGYLSDDELANGAYMNYDRRPSVDQLMNGQAVTPLVWLTATKDRIRWLSRTLNATLDELNQFKAEVPSASGAFKI